MSSPSERYARWAAEKKLAASELGVFSGRYDFELDEFQLAGCRVLESGSSVLVAAPTGAGKTVVGEFAVHLALAQGRKVFYTAPIKALSNQKFGELVDWLGHERVGLLTGDTSIRPDADVVVMTTEVLRNMLYAGSSLLEGLGFVVMDEVHYLADRLRGPVWEEVIIHLDTSVQMVALSATVSNAEEFGAWLQEVRGATEIVVSETRPVPLWQHVVIGEELLDLFVDEDGEAVVSHGPGAQGKRQVNPEIERITSFSLPVDERSGGGRGRSPRGRKGTSGRHRPRGSGQHRPPHMRRGRHGSHGDAQGGGTGGGRSGGPRGGHIPRPMRRPEVIGLLDDAALLPAIMFIFSRAGCEGAVQQCARTGLRLTDDAERREIRAVLDDRLDGIGVEDEEVLGIAAFRRAVLDGYAAHHAGILPLLKTVVEELFARGLLKVVFATETLALGINMPARSVVLEKLVKFNGVDHADLTPGEYTQLTGRAGRRGIDTEGHAVVLAGPGFDAAAVGSLASRRTYPLRSAFRPTPNMAVNLLDRFDLGRARETLETSFAQFQTDRSVVGLARKARELEDTVESYRQAVTCDLGDMESYAEIQEQISAREKTLSQTRAAADRDRTRSRLGSLRRGDVVALPGGKRRGYAVVLDVDRAVLGGPQIDLLDTEARRRSLRPGDVPSAPAVIDSLRLPRQEAMGSSKVRKDTAAALRQRLSGHDEDPRREVRARAERTPSTAATDPALQQLRAELAEHPCAQCPDLASHLRWAGRWRKSRSELEGVQRRIRGRTSSLARQFDRLTDLLVELGYLRHDGEELVPTDRGLRLRRLFSDRDLLIAECIEHGAWTGLDPAGLAAVVSAAVHESRRDDRAPEVIPDPAVDAALAASVRLAAELQSAQTRHGIDPTSVPDPAVAAIVHRWARGDHLAAALAGNDLPPGDFVRHCRQVIDLLDQLPADELLGSTARSAVRAVRRGLVAQEIDR
ncbi:RNA helicase [Brachybacterium alimentarium]|uniref:RNA helicase n=1 Tax=Brachybacterium alimentarium TaxID=47845 RepID=A0A2A3YFR8_9MICO|nr:DEAD/DEAH box helicase [Brachybacterium alimentarium]PCC38183.1 RNA helicase [Brachybacterium alimentarium]RCS71739.1 RNA helicase [Brachybacterium alimentarium]RCS88907.1 RNA helicase [Brachybacterium alimentarium]